MYGLLQNKNINLSATALYVIPGTGLADYSQHHLLLRVWTDTKALSVVIMSGYRNNRQK